MEFLQERASSKNNPVFGNLKDLSKTDVVLKKRYPDPNLNIPRISSFTTQLALRQSDCTADETTPVCPVCQHSHHLQTCPTFLNMTVVERRKVVLESKLCFQCLSFGHYKRTCRCAKCNDNGYRRHHRLLHLSNLAPKRDQINDKESRTRKVITCDANVQTNTANVVPDVYKGATALPVVAVVVRGPDGQCKSSYALLDQASEATFIRSDLQSWTKVVVTPASPPKFSVAT